MKYQQFIKPKLLTLLFTLIFSVFAQAADLSSAKASGYLGEQQDGYLGLVKGSAPGDIKALMNDINSKRSAEYKRIAASNGIGVSEVARMTARKVISQASGGHYVQDSSGRWTRK